MNKKELASIMSNDTNLSKSTSINVINIIINTIKDKVISGDKVSLNNFGTFCTSLRNERVGRNPRTGETINIPSKVVAKFKPGKNFRNSLTK